MTRFTDEKKTVEITMCLWNGSGYDPDWSNDCFNISSLDYDEEKEAYIVDDVDYLVYVARDWENGTMEGEDEESLHDLENRTVFITEC